MDWPLAIDRNREALRRIVAALFVMVGAATAALTSPGLSRRSLGEGGRGAFTLPRQIYAAILLILRPAESAVRRLILIAAHGLVLKPRAARPLPAGLAGFAEASASKMPAFSLFDPLKHFDRDDFVQSANAIPHNSFSSFYEENVPSPQYFSSEEPVDAAQLFSRHALNDLPKQARRLARWQARRDILLHSKRPFRPMRMSPMRPGPPPGRRLRHVHEVDEVLRECHGLARDLMNSS
jgi:hypothetical protein